MTRLPQLLAFGLLAAASLPLAAMQPGGKVGVEDIWKPAKTPPGGLPWAVLERTRVIDRKDKNAMIYSKPGFTPQIQALAGKQVKIAGYMMPLEKAARQKHFVLLGYPPGCPFHMHAMPNQFVEIYAAVPVKVDDVNPTVMIGTLRLTGQNESGIFYKLENARPV